jgi:hypothetical protein
VSFSDESDENFGSLTTRNLLIKMSDHQFIKKDHGTMKLSLSSNKLTYKIACSREEIPPINHMTRQVIHLIVT